MIRVSRGRGAMLTAGVCAFVPIAALFAVGGPWRSRVAARELASAEMSGTFGDTCYPCWEGFVCSSPFVEGNQCVRCISSATRIRCCHFSKTSTDTCTYGSQKSCPESTRERGVPQQPFGTCFSCTSSQYVVDGTCDGLTDAQGNTCPARPNCE